MGLRVYGHPLSSFCWKVLVALYENGTSFEWEHLDLMDGEAAARFARLSPTGKMPALVDEARDLTLSESSIIIEHLDRAYPGPVRFIPADADSAREVRFWDRFYDLYVHAPMQRVIANRLRPTGARDPFGTEQAISELKQAYGRAEAAMDGRTWAAGEAFSLADCAAAPALHYAGKVAPFAADHPALAAYLSRLEARPSFARVLAEAQPYAHMFPQEPEPA